MKIRSRKVGFFAMILALMVLTALPISADMGPKESVTVTFENVGGELCYATLLSKVESNGPWSVWDGSHYQNEKIGIEIWNAFAEYKDSDGFYFHGQLWEISESGSIDWGYYPPSTFKILLYYPERDHFEVSEIYEKYAFYSYYTVDLSEDHEVSAKRNYQWGREIIGLLLRISFTVSIEMVVAAFFGFKGAGIDKLLVLVNLLTQILLNVSLNVIDLNSGGWVCLRWYVILELVIIAIEAAIYCVLLKKLDERKKKAGFYAIYAVVANIISFATGALILALI